MKVVIFPLEKNMKARRGNCLNDIMKELGEPILPATLITAEMLLPSGQCEAAADSSGVLRLPDRSMEHRL